MRFVFVGYIRRGGVRVLYVMLTSINRYKIYRYGKRGYTRCVSAQYYTGDMRRVRLLWGFGVVASLGITDGANKFCWLSGCARATPPPVHLLCNPDSNFVFFRLSIWV